MVRIAILGSTGSIGTSALDVARTHRDRVTVVGLAAGSNGDALAAQVRTDPPKAVAMASGEAMDRLRHAVGGSFPLVSAVGSEGLIAVATHPDVDLVL